MKVLYISYDGMTDPLGQSQVIPYLIGLSAQGHSFHLISFEKKQKFIARKAYLESILKQNNIFWHPIIYTKNPPIVSTIIDLLQMKLKATALHKEIKFDLVHCRSYISSLVGLYMKKHLKTRFLFDMRGFWPEERVEGGIWSLNNPLYKAIYKFFKTKEKEFLSLSDAVISLTHKAKTELVRLHLEDLDLEAKTFVIPCCTDTQHFSLESIEKNTIIAHKTRLDLLDASPIMVYLGSIGTWYMLDEMLDFFKELKKSYPKGKFVFITPDDPNHIMAKAEEKNISKQDLRVFSANREELPSLIALADFSIFFVRPSYSKIASSPTKQGELMSLGIPVICNAGVGDTDIIINKYNAGVVVNAFNDQTYIEISNKIEEITALDKETIVNGAQEYFSLNGGVASYMAVYKFIMTKNQIA